ncbi:MAG: iron-sulfur cluster repair di-iron protein [Kofleriaceae bacterium]
MPLHADQTVAEIALGNPATTRIFEQVGIDYCCGGKRSLAQACAKAGLDVDALLARLAATPPPAATSDWTAVSLAALVAHLVDTHHAFTRSELTRAQALATKVARVHGDRHPFLRELAAAVDEQTADLLAHLAKEEQVLFPAIVRGDRTFVAAPISVMGHEHDAHGVRLAQIRALATDFIAPDDACGSWRALYDSLASLERDLHQHIHLENNVLFPRALSAG